MTTIHDLCHDPDCEKAVLGCLMLDESCLTVWKHYAAMVKSPRHDLFRADRHRIILDAILELYDRGIHPDYTTLGQWLKDTNRLADMDGMGYLMTVPNAAWSSANCEDYLKMLHNRWRNGQMERIKSELEEDLTSGVDLNIAAVKFADGMKKYVVTDTHLITPTAEAMVDASERLLMPELTAGRVLPSSFSRFQDMTGGHIRGQMMLVGAPPGNGKTAFAMQEIDCILKNTDCTVDAFLSESDMDQYLVRYIARTYGMNAAKFNTKSYTDQERTQIINASRQLTAYENRLFLAEKGVYNAAKIDATIRERKERTGKPCDFIVVDYLQRLGAAKQGQSATEHKSFHDNVEILFEICARENAAMLLLSQLTMDAIRESFDNKKKRPGLGAFKGSGSPIEAAKVCMILYKDEKDQMESRVVEQQFVICKANDGMTGIVRSLFIKPLTQHLEDEKPQDREPYADRLRRFGYDPGNTRKDKRGGGDGDGPGF